MENILQSFLVPFIALFITIDAIGLVPIFMSLTSNFEEKIKTAVIKRSVFVAFAVLLFFGLLGTQVLNIFGISLAAFRIAGGILLLIIAIEMVLNKTATTDVDSGSSHQPFDIAVFPLAVPLLSGPATISMLIIFMKQAEHNFLSQLLVLVALFVNMIIALVTLCSSKIISKILGRTGVNTLSRIIGIILVALACQFFINGIIEAFNIKV